MKDRATKNHFRDITREFITGEVRIESDEYGEATLLTERVLSEVEIDTWHPEWMDELPKEDLAKLGEKLKVEAFLKKEGWSMRGIEGVKRKWWDPRRDKEFTIEWSKPGVSLTLIFK